MNVEAAATLDLAVPLDFISEGVAISRFPYSNVRKHIFAPAQQELASHLQAILKMVENVSEVAGSVTRENLPKLLCIALPSTLAKLVLMRRLSCIVLPRHMLVHPIANFPPPEWFVQTQHDMFDIMPQPAADFSVTKIRELTRLVQSLVGKVDGCDASVRHGLSELCRYFLGCLHTLEVAATPVGIGPNSELSAVRQIFAALLASKLQNQESLNDVLALAGGAVPGLQGSFANLTMPDWRMLRRSQFRIDVSLNILQAQARRTSPMLQWCWVDSSPVKHRNFLNTIVSQIRCCDVVSVAEAANTLSRDIESSAHSDIERHLSAEIDRRSLSRRLLLRTTRTLPPVNLGSGKAGLDHKVSSFAYQLYLESLGADKFQESCSSIRPLVSTARFHRVTFS